MSQIPTIQDIELAYERIKSHVDHTPVFMSSSINRMIGCEIYFKCENLQKGGAFKFRGATNAIRSLTEEEAKRGVATHSSGNHAAAIALAARQHGISSYVVMPRTAPQVKKKAVETFGAEIVYCEPTLQAREDSIKEVVRRTNAVFIHPYNDLRIICGQATACLELVHEVKNLDMIIAPVSGGGLLSGTALYAAYMSPNIKVIGAEPEGADDAFQSFKAGKIIPMTDPNTIADGLRASLGTLTFPIIKKYVDRIITTPDEQIIQAMRLIWERMKLIVEPSAAVPLAILFQNLAFTRNKKIGIILSGGNVDFDNLPW
jgi:threonine dehydratase